MGVQYNTLICYVYTFAVSIHGVSQVALVAENLPANAGDAKDVGSIPGLGRSPEYEIATSFSILAWKIPWTEEPVVESTLRVPMDCSTPGFPVLHYFLEFAQTHVCCVNDAISPSNLILCRPLLLLPSIFPSIRIFPKESVLHIRWPKYWSFSFSISPSNEYSGLIPLGWTGWISLQSKGLSRVFSNTTVQKHQFFSTQLSL